ncbi:fluoride efflux transporter FluC [Rummeliibacillus pycnus]|uniref:fluoride efflux transporter FluC n=1 Tax=Rummeliibacillus pycnus TaxID=101070 RepID=UPI001FE53EFD|nr:CrcB family protein [Rummeliibacillus pycnus]
MIKNILAVVLGGMLGTLLRYGVILCTPTEWMLWIANGLGSFVMGIFNGLFTRFPQCSGWKLFLTTGMLGAFTTFSTFSANWFKLMQTSTSMAIIYASMMTILCIVLASFGFLLTASKKKAGEQG